MKKIIISLAILVIIGLAYYGVHTYQENLRTNIPGIASGNGRLEATEVNIATKLSGRLDKLYVNDGDMVKPGQLLGLMQTNVLEAQLAQAKARHAQAITAEAAARADINVKISELEAAKAKVNSKEANLKGAQKRFERAKQMLKTKAISAQAYDNDETVYLTAKADYAAAEASMKQAQAAINSAKAEAEGAKANIKAMQADIDAIQADLDDCRLLAPLGGRIQYRISQPGEVLNSGGRVLNLVDLTDVYITFFLPESVAGKVRIGADARILLDAIPDIPIPAKVSFVASVAQFTPKTVETKIERQKLMFRVKARIAPELLQKYIEYVKTGIPGMAYVKINPDAKWPEFLQTKADKAADK